MITLDAESFTDAKLEVQDLAGQARREEEMARLQPKDRKQADIPLGEALDAWLATLEIRDSTAREYRLCACIYKRQLDESRYVREITIADLERAFFGAWKLRSGRTKLKHLAMLARFFRWCVKHAYRVDNPAEALEAPKAWSREVRAARETKGQALMLEEARKLLRVAGEPYVVKIRGGHEDNREPPGYVRLFVLVALRTGLRAGNIVGPHGIRWGDVDLEAGVLRLSGARMKNHLDFMAPIHEELLEELRARVNQLPRVPRAADPIIALGRPQRSVTSALKRAGLRDRGFRIHDLRHSFGSWLGEICPEAVVKNLMGLAAGNVTQRYSTHQGIETLREHLNRLPWLTKRTKTEKKARVQSK